MESPVVLVVSKDLLALDRIERIATNAGWTARSLAPEHGMDDAEASLIVVDLDALTVDGLPSELTARTVGYYSHVDEELGRRARAVGIETFPRGRFWRELPKVMEEERR